MDERLWLVRGWIGFKGEGNRLTERDEKADGEEGDQDVPSGQAVALGLLVEDWRLEEATPLADAAAVMPEVRGPHLRGFAPRRAAHLHHDSVLAGPGWCDGHGVMLWSSGDGDPLRSVPRAGKTEGAAAG